MPNVLVAEDDVEMCRFIVGILEREGYAVSEAHDGAEALDKALKNPPEVLVLDLMMPKADGFEVIRRIREGARTKDLPIIVCSALARKSLPDPEKSVLNGIVAHFTKPFDVKEFLNKVRLAVEGENGNAPKSRTIVV